VLPALSPPGTALRQLRGGLLQMTGDKHRQQRQALQPLFLPAAVNGHVADMADLVRGELDRWPVGRPTDLVPRLRRVALSLSSYLLFGREEPSRAAYLDAQLRELFRRSYAVGTYLCLRDWPGTPFRKLLRCAERVRAAVAVMIDERRADPGRRRDVLDALVAARTESERFERACRAAGDGFPDISGWLWNRDSGLMTEQNLFAHVASLFFASYDTLSSALAWAVFLVAQHPQVARELHAELTAALAGEPPTADRLAHLPLLDAAVKESLRVIPAAPVLPRAVLRPVELGGIALGPGDRIWLSLYVTHHLPELFPEPQRFRPERWFDIKPGPYEYLPFGAGPHHCLGHAFATAALKVTLALLLQRWRPTVRPGARVSRWFRQAIFPRHGLPVCLRPHDGCFESVRVRGNVHEMVDLPDPQVLRPGGAAGRVSPSACFLRSPSGSLSS
jgi:cytochrome P450